MDNKYNVDDILNEIKRKKSARLSGVEEEAPVHRPDAREDGEYIPKHGIATAELDKVKQSSGRGEQPEKPEQPQNEHAEYDRFVREYAEREKLAARERLIRENEEARAAQQKQKYSEPEPPEPYVPRTARITQKDAQPMPTYTDDYRDEPMAQRRIQIDDTLQDFFRPKEVETPKPRRAKKTEQKPQRGGAFTVVSEEDDGDDYEPLRATAQPGRFSAPSKEPEADAGRQAEEHRVFPSSVARAAEAQAGNGGSSVATDYEELKRQRSYKISSFSLDRSGDDEPDVPKAEAPEARRYVHETPSVTRAREEYEKYRPAAKDDGPGAADTDDIDEYTSRDQNDSVIRDFWRQKNSLVLRLVTTAALCVALVVTALNAAGFVKLPVSLAFGEGDNSLFFIVNILLLCAIVLVCHVPVGGGLLALLKRRANSDTLVSVCTVATLIHAVSMVVLADRITIVPANIYFWIPALALVFNTIGKLSTLERISGNFEIVGAAGEKNGVALAEDPDLRKRLTGVRRDEPGMIAGAARTELLSGFLGLSYDDDFADNLYRTAAPIAIIASLAVAVALYIVRRDIFLSFTTFAALTAIGAPFTSTLAAALPLSSACKSLRQDGAMLASYTAAEEIAETNVVLFDATDIFRPGDIELHAIKTFSRGRVDEALLDTASVICQVKNTLSFIFEKVISGNTAMLKSYDNLVYEDGMGLSAWVNSKRVLIGNRTLLEHHGVETPDIEYERRYTSAGQNVIYLSNSGELTAMFVLSYKPSAESREAFAILKRRGVSVSVSSTDPNVTARMLSELFSFPEDRINIVSSRYQSEFNSVCAPRPSLPAKAAAGNTAASLARVISAAFSVRSRVSAAVMLQLAGMVIGCALVAFFAFIGGISSMSALFVMVYQLCWLLIVTVAGTIRLK